MKRIHKNMEIILVIIWFALEGIGNRLDTISKYLKSIDETLKGERK
jgi:hypothetical protein